MRRVLRLLPFLVFAGILGVIVASDMLTPLKTYSSTEKRELAGLPDFSAKKFRKGKFQKKYETYLSDQFPARDSWVKLQTGTERLMGKRESNGVYFGEDGYLLEKYTEEDFDAGQVEKNIKALARFVKQAQKADARVHVMMVPSKTQMMREKLPAFADSYNEEIFYEMLEQALPRGVLVPVAEALSRHTQEEIYYRTDHHWTTLGAWYGYQAYRGADGVELEGGGLIPAEQKRELRTVTEEFLGTSQAKVNLAARADEIQIYEPRYAMTVVYNLGERTEEGFYQMDYLEKKDKYSVFFGGNQAVLELSGGAENGRVLFVVKDSFANCMLPFLAEDYERVIVVDLRMLNVGKKALLQQFQPTDVLVLYNTVQFMQDIEFAIKK